MRLHPSLIVALVACVPAIAGAQAKNSVVIASVTDAKSGQPIADAQVTLDDLNITARTDWSGEARIAGVAGGEHNFIIVKPGYDSMVVALQVQGDSVGPVFRLLKSGTTTATLTPVTVPANPATSYLADFERRRQEGRGKYMTADELEKKANRSLVAVLAQAFGGLMSTPDPARPGHNILMSRRTRPRLDRADIHCGIDIYLDSSPYLDDLEAIRPSELAGVEYYPIESAPGEYRKLSDNCGVLILWSKK
ncbi:MAG TPA: carboxypeptidase-like regulatory domain-containing protein [Gemmatimonadaceae bacterium]|nr:carboxypeptidase-like regulatory domain-containing protein [Gemmatimonadaceae bacterium]